MSSGVQQYRRNRDGVIVEAIQFNGENRSVVEQWLASYGLGIPPFDQWQWVVLFIDVVVFTDAEFRASFTAQ